LEVDFCQGVELTHSRHLAVPPRKAASRPAEVLEARRVVRHLHTIASSSESTEDPKVKEAFFIVESSRKLVELTKLIESGVLQSIVSEVLPINAAAQAYLRFNFDIPPTRG
jgi:hypothetical protein